MSVAPGTKGVLLVGFAAALGALFLAAALSRVAPRAAAAAADPHPTDPLAGRESAALQSYVEKPSGHFRILYEGGAQQAIGDRVARVLENEYRRVGRTLNSYPADTLTVVLFTNQEFRDLTHAPAWSSGNFDGRIRVAVGGALQSPRELDRLVTHELVHAIVASAVGPRGRVPAWLNEGLATHLEASDHAWTATALRSATTIVPLERLVTGFGGLDEQEALVAYAESATAAEILCARLGPNIGGFLQMIGQGRSVDEALLEFQVQPNAFDAEWRRRVGIR